MRLWCDLHIHTALSPCADDDMTPNNIVNMALLKGLDLIAVTDHNSSGNLRAVEQAAAGRLLVLPGIEVSTVEEVHVLCYFPTVNAAEQMGCIIKERLKIKNKPQFFGHQLFVDAEDNVVGVEDMLLCAAADIKLSELIKNVSQLGGRGVFAHIDRPGCSVMSNLGFIPVGIDVKTVEITKMGMDKYGKSFPGYKIITNSDAHTLGNILEPVECLEVFTKSTKEILKIL